MTNSSMPDAWGKKVLRGMIVTIHIPVQTSFVGTFQGTQVLHIALLTYMGILFICPPRPLA